MNPNEPVTGDPTGPTDTAAAPDAGERPSAVEPGTPAPAASRPPRTRRPRAAAAPSDAGQPEAAVEAPAPVPVQADAEAGSDGQEPAESGDADGSRRGRNRRRGRGKDRGVREAGAVPGPDAEAGAAPAAVEPVDAQERFDEVLSGAYDAEPPEPDDEAALEQASKRVLRPEPEAPKLHKVLAQSGIGSRRDMEQLIQEGAVTVNDEVAHIGMRIAQGDRVAINGKPVRIRIQGAPARLLAYHKPVGEVVTLSDPEGRPTVFRRLPRLETGKWQSVGRLDINTEGLLLFTTSGELANQLMHPRFGVEREYAVRVLGSLDDTQRARLLEGVEVDGQSANFKRIEDGGGEGANRWYRVVITEGRNREVRKLFEQVGLAVSRLIRIRYGGVVLPRGLRRGVWVELGEQDLRAVRRALGPVRGEAREAGPSGGAGRGGRGNAQGGKPAGGRGAAPSAGGGRGRPGGGDARPPRRDREERTFESSSGDGGEEDFGRIPNPLEQTFDRRFAKGPRRGTNQGFGHGRPEAEHGPGGGSIPNPLEQTFDKRFVKGSQRINAGFGRPEPEGGNPAPRKGGPKQPDPMQTSVGYIGADAYFNKLGGNKRGKGGGRRGR